MAHEHTHAHRPIRLANLLDDLIELTETGKLRWKVENSSRVTAKRRDLSLVFEAGTLMVFDKDGEIVDEARMDEPVMYEKGAALWKLARTSRHTAEQRNRMLLHLSIPRTSTPAPPDSRAAAPSSSPPRVPNEPGSGDQAWYARPPRPTPRRF